MSYRHRVYAPDIPDLSPHRLIGAKKVKCSLTIAKTWLPITLNQFQTPWTERSQLQCRGRWAGWDKRVTLRRLRRSDAHLQLSSSRSKRLHICLICDGRGDWVTCSVWCHLVTCRCVAQYQGLTWSSAVLTRCGCRGYLFSSPRFIYFPFIAHRVFTLGSTGCDRGSAARNTIVVCAISIRLYCIFVVLSKNSLWPCWLDQPHWTKLRPSEKQNSPSS